MEWPCIECRIKDQRINEYKAEYESLLPLVKNRVLLTSNILEKFREKHIECQKLHEFQKVCVDAIANYRERLKFSFESTVPVRISLSETREELKNVQSQLVFEQEMHNATRQLHTHTNDKLKQLQEENSELMKKLEEFKETNKSLQQQVKVLKHKFLKQEKIKQRLKLALKAVEGRRGNKKFMQDLGADVSDDEGIFSVDRLSVCSSLDSPNPAIADVAVCLSPEMLPGGHLDVHSKDKTAKLNDKEIETCRTNSLPLLTTQSAENEDHEKLSFPSTLVNNQSSSSANGLQCQHKTGYYKKHESKKEFEKAETQKVDLIEHKDPLQIYHKSLLDHNYSLQRNFSLSADVTSTLSLNENEIVPLTGISDPECENLSQSNAMLQIASKVEKQIEPKQKIRSIFDSVEKEEHALQTKSKFCPSNLETVSIGNGAVHEKQKNPKCLLLLEHDKQPMDDSSCLIVDDSEEYSIDKILQEMRVLTMVPEFLPEGSTQRKPAEVHDIAIQTENLCFNRETQTCVEAEGCTQRKPAEVHDIAIQTENLCFNRETQTCVEGEGLHNKKNLVSEAFQTEVQSLQGRHISTCNSDGSNTVNETSYRAACACTNTNALKAHMDLAFKEPVNSPVSCKLNQQPQCSTNLEDDAKKRCNMPNRCSTKPVAEHNKCEEKLQLLINAKLNKNSDNLTSLSYIIDSYFRDHYDKTSQQFECKNDLKLENFRTFWSSMLTSLRSLSALSSNIFDFREHGNKTSQQVDSENAVQINTSTHHIPSGGCLWLSKRFADEECSMIDVDSNCGSYHEDSNETLEELKNGNNSRNQSHDRLKNVNLLENTVSDSDSQFNIVSEFDSDGKKNSCKANVNNLLRKTAVENYRVNLVEHNLPAKEMRKRNLVSSPEEDDFKTATNAENIKPTDTEENNLVFVFQTKHKQNKQLAYCRYNFNTQNKISAEEKMRKKSSKRSLVSSPEEDDFTSTTNAENIKPTDTEENYLVKDITMHRQLMKKSVNIDIPVSSLETRSKIQKTSHVSQNNPHSLPSILEATESKTSGLLPSPITDFGSTESLQVRPGSGTVVSAKLSSESSTNQTFEMSSIKSTSLPIDVQVSSLANDPKEFRDANDNQSNANSSQSVLPITAPKAKSICTKPDMSHLLPGKKIVLENKTSSQIRQVGSSTTASTKLSETSFHKFEANTENSVSRQPREVRESNDNQSTESLQVRQTVNVNDSNHSVFQTKPKQSKQLAYYRYKFNTQNRTSAEAASLQKVIENKPTDSADKTEQQSYESVSYVQNKIQEDEKDSKELSRSSPFRCAFKFFLTDIQQERNKKAVSQDCSKIQQRIRRILKKLTSENFIPFVFKELVCINRKYAADLVARSIVNAVEKDITLVDTTHTPPAPPLTVLQRLLMILTFKLHDSDQKFEDLPKIIRTNIEYKTLRLGSAPKMEECQKLVRFYSAVCRLLNDKERLQLYCLDVLYSLQYKSAPILHIALCIFPEALPHANRETDDLLMKCLVVLIFNSVRYKTRTSFGTKPLKDLLHQCYGYEPEEFNVDQFLSFVLEKLRNEENNEVPIALILLGKRMPHQWTYRTLLRNNLIPLVNEWKAGKLQDSTIAKILPVIGYITRCFPIGESRAFIEEVKCMYTSIMEDENIPSEVREGAAMGLISLSRHDANDILDLLKNWQPQMEFTNELLHKIAAFMHFKPPSFWTNVYK